MMDHIKNFRFGAYLTIVSMIVGVIGLIRYLGWSTSYGGVDYIVAAGFVIALMFDLILICRDDSVFCILATAGYSLALFRILADSVGTFVDMFQGINMFGDVTQIGNIVSISAFAAVSTVLSMIVSFMPIRKAECECTK